MLDQVEQTLAAYDRCWISNRQLGADAHLDLSAYVLRHTCLTNLVRRGHDLVPVAEIAGHRRLETIRRYCLPSLEDREAAMEGLRVEY